MKSYKIAFTLLSLAAASCDGDGTSKTVVNSCTLDLAMSPDGTPMLMGDCTRDAKGIAAAMARADNIVKSAQEVALGRIPFAPSGAFDRCAVMARLAADPRWTASIDSNEAGAPLRDALRADELAPSISTALAKAARKFSGVSLETVLLSDSPANDCPKSPARTPVEAQIWLRLE